MVIKKEWSSHPHIRVNPNTKKLLDKIKGKDESYNSILVKLINKYLGVKK